ncbi:MAG: hypothetical protein AAFQ51_19475 [Pseudomonadota bacterium]
MTAISPADPNLAMVVESSALYRHLSGAPNRMTPLRTRDLARLPLIGPLRSRVAQRRMREQAADMGEAVQITPPLNKRPRQLSGGQGQPAAFPIDEPISKLRAALRVHMGSS